MKRRTRAEAVTNEELLERVVREAREKRGDDVVVLDVRKLADYMDYLVIVTGRSERQNRAIADHLIRMVKQAGRVPLSRSGIEAGNWICVDLVDVVIHVMTPEVRALYDLELLWGDAPAVAVASSGV
jgi:ribosome-associated protein